MKTFTCRCDNTVFFENSHCVACGSELGWCPNCASLRSLLVLDNGQYQCAHPGCGMALIKCHNYAVEQVCNRCVPAITT